MAWIPEQTQLGVTLLRGTSVPTRQHFQRPSGPTIGILRNGHTRNLLSAPRLSTVYANAVSPLVSYITSATASSALFTRKYHGSRSGMTSLSLSANYVTAGSTAFVYHLYLCVHVNSLFFITNTFSRLDTKVEVQRPHRELRLTAKVYPMRDYYEDHRKKMVSTNSIPKWAECRKRWDISKAFLGNPCTGKTISEVLGSKSIKSKIILFGWGFAKTEKQYSL